MFKLFKEIFGLEDRISRLRRILKGSSETPFLYLGIISIVLFGLAVLGSGTILNSLTEKGNLSLAAI